MGWIIKTIYVFVFFYHFVTFFKQIHNYLDLRKNYDKIFEIIQTTGKKKWFISYRIDPDFTAIFHFRKLRQWHNF